jgi:hypothetical protein
MRIDYLFNLVEYSEAIGDKVNIKCKGSLCDIYYDYIHNRLIFEIIDLVSGSRGKYYIFIRDWLERYDVLPYLTDVEREDRIIKTLCR